MPGHHSTAIGILFFPSTSVYLIWHPVGFCHGSQQGYLKGLLRWQRAEHNFLLSFKNIHLCQWGWAPTEREMGDILMDWQSSVACSPLNFSSPLSFCVFFVMQHRQCLKSFPLHGLWLISQILMEVILMVQYKVWGVEKRFINEWDKVPAYRNLTIMWVGPLWLARMVSMEKGSFQFEMKWGESSKYQEGGSVESDFFF